MALNTLGNLGRILSTPIPISRKSFLTAVGGLAAGAPVGAAGAGYLRPTDSNGGETSYAQAGEDLAAWFFFQYVGLASNITYLDVGANDPIKNNNTYFFYRRGGRGVLVEPNASMCRQLRSMQPKDTTLEAGIGVTSIKEADFYVMTDPSWNTFSKEEAEQMQKSTAGAMRIKNVIKMPLLNINDVIETHLQTAPHFLSIDAEGLHLAILKSMDFERFRPPLICVETLVSGARDMLSEIPEFLTSKNYVVRGGSFVNTLFVDRKYA